MSKIRATWLLQEQLAKEHQQSVTELHELSRQLVDCVEEIQKFNRFTVKAREWSRTDLVN
jgi:hypothetical protein